MPPKSLLPVFAFFVFYVHSKKSTEQMKKVPTIVLSVSYKGVKFIDATNKVCLSSITEKCPHGRVASSPQPDWIDITFGNNEGYRLP